MNPLFLLLALLLGWAGSWARANEISLPVPPADLLGCLPSPPANWRLTASHALHLKQNPLKSRAAREYLQIKDPGTANEQLRVSLTLVDTCGDEALVHLFKEQDGNEDRRLTISGFPAMRTTGPDGSERISVLLLNRFLLILTGSTKESFKVEDWIGLIDQAVLKSRALASGMIDVSKDHEVTIQRVDELQPSRNSTARFRIANETF